MGQADEVNKAPPGAKKANGAGGGTPEGEDPTASVEKIREILFGSQKLEYDKRISRLEQRLLEETSQLRDETSSRLDTIEEYVKKEISAMLDRVKAETSNRVDACKGISQDLKEQAKTLESRTTKLAEDLSGTQRDLREQILAQSKELRDELRRRCESIASDADESALELRGSKLDRAALATILTEAASRLADGENSKK